MRNLNDVLAGLDEFRRLGAAEKQEVCEAAVISGGLLLAMLQQAREEEAAAKAARARAHHDVNTMPAELIYRTDWV